MLIKSLLEKLKHKKYLISLLLFLLSFILFFPKAKFIIDIDINETSNASISYITPFEAQYKFSKPTNYIFDSNSRINKITINGRSIKKVQVIMYNYSPDMQCSIKSAGIKFWYLPLFKFNMDKMTVNKDHLNYIIEFQDISPLVIIIPVILITVMCITLFMLLCSSVYKLYVTKKQSIKNNILLIGVIIFIILLEFIKINAVKVFFGTEIIEHNYFLVVLQIIKYDSFFILVMLILFWSALQIKSKYITYLALFLVSVLSFLYAVDISLIVLFNSRLILYGADTGQLMPDIATIYGMVKALWDKNIGIYVFMLLIYTLVLTVVIAKKKDLYKYTKPVNIAAVVTAVIFTGLILFNDFVGFYRYKNIYSNIISVNFLNKYNNKYSQEKIEKIKKDFNYEYTCVDGLNARQNIIIIFIESLSSYKSSVFSGIENKIPHIDNLALNNMYILNYYGNGANSQLGLYSLLTGINPVTSNNVLTNKKSYEDSIPAHFKKQGYKTVLYSGANITYASANQIAAQAGIEEMYDTVYNNVYDAKDTKYIFNGVDDKVLYSSVLNWYKNEENKKQPFFMVIKTLTTHQPYVDPLSYQQSFDKTLSFADNAVNEFIENLKKDGYFENGMVIITGDHRAMLPVSEKEYKKLGPLAHAAIPLVIIDGGGQKKIQGAFSHTDLGKSLEYLTLDKVCFNQFQRNIFADNNKEGCVIHQQMIDLSLVDIRCGDTYGQVLLDGDKTRFIKDTLNISEKYKKEIIDYINYIRIFK